MLERSHIDHQNVQWPSNNYGISRCQQFSLQIRYTIYDSDHCGSKCLHLIAERIGGAIAHKFT